MIRDCGAAIELKPLYVSAMLRRATALEATGELKKACEDLRCCLTIEPANSRATKALSRLQGPEGVADAVAEGAAVEKRVEVATAQEDLAAVAASGVLAKGKSSSDAFDEKRLVKPGEWDEWDAMMKADEEGGDEELLADMMEKQMREMRASLTPAGPGQGQLAA